MKAKITSEEKIKRFDSAFKLLADLSFKAPEIRPSNAVTVEILGRIICNGERLGQIKL
jgi:hypothetical protein